MADVGAQESMDDILAQIRRIIAEDTAGKVAPTLPPRATPSPVVVNALETVEAPTAPAVPAPKSISTTPEAVLTVVAPAPDDLSDLVDADDSPVAAIEAVRAEQDIVAAARPLELTGNSHEAVTVPLPVGEAVLRTVSHEQSPAQAVVLPAEPVLAAEVSAATLPEPAVAAPAPAPASTSALSSLVVPAVSAPVSFASLFANRVDAAPVPGGGLLLPTHIGRQAVAAPHVPTAVKAAESAPSPQHLATSPTAASSALGALAAGLAASGLAHPMTIPEPPIVERGLSAEVGIALPPVELATSASTDAILDAMRPILTDWIADNLPRALEGALRDALPGLIVKARAVAEQKLAS